MLQLLWSIVKKMTRRGYAGEKQLNQLSSANMTLLSSPARPIVPISESLDSVMTVFSMGTTSWTTRFLRMLQARQGDIRTNTVTCQAFLTNHPHFSSSRVASSPERTWTGSFRLTASTESNPITRGGSYFLVAVAWRMSCKNRSSKRELKV